MPIIMNTSIPTRELYEQVDAKLGTDPIPGLIVHTAREEGGEVRVTDVWESTEALQAFVASRLGPAVAAVTGEAPTGPPDMTEVFNIRRG